MGADFLDDFFVEALFGLAFVVADFLAADFFVVAGLAFLFTPADFLVAGFLAVDFFLVAFFLVDPEPVSPKAESQPELYFSFVPTRTMAMDARAGKLTGGSFGGPAIMRQPTECLKPKWSRNVGVAQFSPRSGRRSYVRQDVDSIL